MSNEHKTLRLWSPAVESRGSLPEIHLRRDANLSPPLCWEHVPVGAEALALLCFDPDAPRLWFHWVLANIPPSWTELPQNFPRLRQSQGWIQGSNSFHAIGYDGPEPPPGEEHRYVFRLYALKQRLNISAGMPGEQVSERLKGKILARCDFLVHAQTPASSCSDGRFQSALSQLP